MPIIPDLAGVPGNADLYPHEYSQETAALPLGFRTGVGVRDATLVHDTHGYLEQLSAIPPGNGFLSTSLDPSFSPFQAQGHLSPTQEAQTDLSFQYATPPFTNNYGASDFSLTQEAQTDLSFQYATPPFTTNYGASDFSLTQEAQTDLSFQYATPPFTTNYGASDFSLTQEVQTDLSFQYATPPLTTNYGANDFSLIQDQADFSFQGTAPPLTTNYGASDFFYTGDEYLEVDGSNLFSAPPTPVPTFAPTPALTFEPPTPVSTFEAPTLAPIVGSSSFARFARSEQRRKNRPLSFRAPPIPPSQAAEKQPPVAIGRGPRQVSLPHTRNNHANPRRRSFRPTGTPTVYHCSYRCGRQPSGFQKKRDCTRHEETVHGKPRENGMGNYVCKCLKEFPRKDNLKKHLETCTSLYEPSHFVCQCRTNFDDFSDFELHIEDCGPKKRKGRPTKQSQLAAAPGAGDAESMG